MNEEGSKNFKAKLQIERIANITPTHDQGKPTQHLNTPSRIIGKGKTEPIARPQLEANVPSW